ncbi:MAG: AraC family transcriptional regulator [Pseudonocardiales bacterium]|nr:MAG: AraC family transcriptional regulator [Pseudonocardiales bacterium]
MTETPPCLTETPDLGSGDLGSGVGIRDPFEVVPQVLDLVRLTGAIFFRSHFRAPWAYTSPATLELAGALPPGAGSLVMFHIIAEGHCWVALEDGVKRDLSRGDVVVMPYGDAHSMGSPAYAEPVSIATLLPPRPWTKFPHVEYGGCGEHTLVVCGYLRGDAVLFDPVLRALPSLFVVRPPAGPAAAWVTACVDYALMASQSLHGAARMNHRLPELLFTEVLRLYLDGSCDAELTGWLAALRDPVVGQALSLLHAQPARDWTVAELAVAVAASKTVLGERFLQMLGRPPIRYLTEWRLNLASGLLRTTGLGVGEISTKVGYTSEEAFSRAFKRALGKAPAHWRADRHQPRLPT